MTRLRAIIRTDRLASVWLVLVVATIISWRVGKDHGVDGTVATTIVLIVAFFKVRLVGLHFMELSTAPRGLRLAFEAYCVIVCAALVGMYVAGGA
jgi:caa(3)-type oxidase subunit IV